MNLGYITDALPTPAIVPTTPVAQARAWLRDTSPTAAPVTVNMVAPVADSQIPRNVTMTMPSVTTQANNEAEIAGATHDAPLRPSDLSRPLPNIVTTEPVNIAPPCDAMTQWINENPMMALGALGVLAYFMFGKKGL